MLNARRAGLLAEAREVPLFAALGVGPTLLVVAFKVVGPGLFALQFLAALELERRARKRAPADYRPFLAALGIFAVSLGFWTLDDRRIGCDPDRHGLQGHALWHALNALVFVALYRFYSQFQPGYSRASAAS